LLFQLAASYATSGKQQSVLLFSGVASIRLHPPHIKQWALMKWVKAQVVS
jgi:hypothetical protein